MKCELGREIRYRHCGRPQVPARPPRSDSGLSAKEFLDGAVVDLKKGRVLRYFFKARGTHELEHLQRVVMRKPPERIVQPAEYFPRPGIPTPPQIRSQLVQAFDAFRERRIHNRTH